MTIEVPEKLESALKAEANARGVSATGYILEVLELHLAHGLASQPSKVPFRTGRGVLTGLGGAPSIEDVRANREEMFKGFGENVK
jgi:hypothetical protein